MFYPYVLVTEQAHKGKFQQYLLSVLALQIKSLEPLKASNINTSFLLFSSQG